MVYSESINGRYQRWIGENAARGNKYLVVQCVDHRALVDANLVRYKLTIATHHHHGKHFTHMADDQF